jgi:hypothetical protein
MTIVKNGSSILTLEDWERLAPPKSRIHWKDGRSAKETARAWLGLPDSQFPVEVTRTLSTSTAFGQFQEWDAEPEAKLYFDNFAGEPRNSDLLIQARDTHGSFLIAVEAKADETFGETIANALSVAVERYVENDKSNGVIRIQHLAAALLGPRNKYEPPLNKIRYQLLTACAGVLCEAAEKERGQATFLAVSVDALVFGVWCRYKKK